MPPKEDNVQKLLAAEQKRNRMIAEAKARKQQKLKQAKLDSEQKVAAFRKEKEDEYQAYYIQQNSGADLEKESCLRETENQLQELRTLTDFRMEKVVNKTVQFIIANIE
ncbi:unnamed protein product [Phytomonas sp. Hart1]|nr:unnamed protein product [Phytomonas sp. Hart1]|eukprot:CCW68262.1 unnamed protein product [Phytomonas sp. isolate Hart1]